MCVCVYPRSARSAIVRYMCSHTDIHVSSYYKQLRERRRVCLVLPLWVFWLARIERVWWVIDRFGGDLLNWVFLYGSLLY